MYQLPGSAPLTDKDFDRYEQRNESLDSSLPELISHFFTTEPISRWYIVAPLIAEAPAETQTALRRQLSTGIRVAMIVGKSDSYYHALNLLLYLSPNQRTKILSAAFECHDTYLHDSAAAYIRYAPSEDQAALVGLALLESSPRARIHALQGVDALPEAPRAFMVQRGLRDPDITVALKAAEMIERLPPAEQPEARALVPVVIRRGFLDKSCDGVEMAASMIRYAPDDEQPVLRDQLSTILNAALNVPAIPVTPKLGPRLRWVFQQWSAPTRDITRWFTLAKVIDEAPAEKQNELRSLLPALLREALAEGQTERNAFIATDTIRYAPAEMRSAFILAVFSNKDPYLRDRAARQIQYAPESERSALLQRAQQDPAAVVRSSAVHVISFIPASERTPFVIRALMDPVSDVAGAMIEDADCIPPQAWQAVVEAGMKSPNEAIVTFAAGHLCYIPDEAAERIRGEYSQYFTDLTVLASHSALYEGAGAERFTRQKFEKTGTDLTLLDRPLRAAHEQSLREKTVIRTIPLTAYLAWRKAFEAADVWKAHGFDYVPVEPIVRISSKQHRRNVDVATGVINGPSAGAWQEQGGTCMGEIIDAVDEIDRVLEELGIDHQHAHYGNFVLLFDRDEHGTPIITTPPRIYLIDFDQATMEAPKT